MPQWSVRFDLHVDVDAPDVVRLVAEVESLARVIRGVPIPPSVRARLDALNILRAVRGTTGIEGSDLSEEEVREVLAAEHVPVLARPRAREEQEVRNAAGVMEFISDTLRAEPHLPVSEDLIGTIHRLTTHDIAYPHNTPGVYRSHGVSAGSYVPPRDRDEIVRLMRQFIAWVNGAEATSWPAAIRAVAAHFYFISVHPFGDGNGRTARAIESYLLYQGRVNVLGFYSLSNFYYRRRPEYIEALDDARFRTGGSLTPFVRFALHGLVEELEAVHAEVLAAVAEIAFRDLAHEELLLDQRLGRKVGQRLYHLLLGLRDPVPLRDIRDGRHMLSALYVRLSPKTLSRDVQYLRDRRLVIVEGGRIRANVDLMRDYLP
jgi:Fic family protein